MLDQIPPDLNIVSVTQAAACDIRKCHDAIAEREVHALIPPRRNAMPWNADTAAATAGNDALRISRRPGRFIWRR